jgi:hypothetical protein
MDVEKPFRAAEQRLASATEATVDADDPEKNIENGEEEVYVHLQLCSPRKSRLQSLQNNQTYSPVVADGLKQNADQPEQCVEDYDMKVDMHVISFPS